MPFEPRYYTLIASLPALPSHFSEAERLPISAPRLEQRLRMLESKDALIVERLRDFLVWERQPLERTDLEVVEHYDRAMEMIPNQFAKGLIHRALTVRTIVAALRCRRLKIDPPPGETSIAKQIRRNWTHPDFRLGYHYPWIPEVDTKLNSDSPYEFERQRLEIAWRHDNRIANGYFFTFEAVLLYLVRWEIVYRWTHRDPEAGQAKFQQLVTEALGEYATIFPE